MKIFAFCLNSFEFFVFRLSFYIKCIVFFITFNFKIFCFRSNAELTLTLLSARPIPRSPSGARGATGAIAIRQLIIIILVFTVFQNY